MSPFEFVSVAVALFYAMALGRLVNGLTPSLRPDARWLVQFAWIVILIATGILQWWMFWSAASVSWTALRFLFVLTLPGILLARAGILLGEQPEEVVSFRDQFIERRVPFFALAIAAAIQGSLSPWVLGGTPWFQLVGVHRVSAIFVVLGAAGILLRGERSHAALAFLYSLAVVIGFSLAPGIGDVPT